MRTNPFFDILEFLAGASPDHRALAIRWLLVALYWGLLLASIVIAWRSWAAFPEQRKPVHLGTWVIRVLLGSMWFQGSLWKLPFPVSPGIAYWTEQMAEHAAFAVHSDLVKSVYLPYLHLMNPFIYLTELTLAVTFMLGLFVRGTALLGIFFTLHLWLGLYRHPAEWPWLYIFLVMVQCFFILHAAGRSLGLDLWLQGWWSRQKSPLLRLLRLAS